MKRTYEIIGAPFGFAANKGGSSRAPSFLREHGLTMKIRQRQHRWNEDISDTGDVPVGMEVHEMLERCETVQAIEEYGHQLYEQVKKAFFSKHTPIIIGGDHSISIATISAAASYVKEEYHSDRLGVIWVDAHADLSDWDHGHMHGKIAAILLGLGTHDELIHMGGFSPKLLPQHLIYIGLSDIIPNEYNTLQEKNIQVYGMGEIESQGIQHIINSVVTQLEEITDAIFMTFDIDSCDGAIYRGCAVPEVGGLTGREAIHIVHRISQSAKFIGADFVEFSPEDDVLHNTNELLIKLIDASMGYRM